MRNRILFLSISFLLFWSILPIMAQQVKVGGTVTDENGDPVELATIYVEGTLIGTTSNLKGRYSLKFESRDTVTIIYSMIGYSTRKRQLIRPSGNISLNVMLPAAGYELGEVTITERRRQTGSVQQIELKENKWMPDVSGGSIESIISTQAGVSSNNELSTQYNVRGGSYDENMVYVNGIEIYRPLLIRSGEQEGLSFINPDMVESVGFSSGGFEAQYGDKMSSVLDITYKTVDHFEASGSVSLLGASAYAGFGNRKFSWTNSFRYKTNRYLLGSLDTKGEYDPRFLDYQTFLNWRPNKRWEIGAIGYISDNQYHFIPEDRTTKFGTMETAREFKVYFEGQEKDVFSTYFGAAHVKYRFNDLNDITLQASAFHTQEKETYDITGQYWLNELDESVGSEPASSGSGTMGVGTYMEHARNYLNANVQTLSLKGSHRAGRHNLLWGIEWKKEEIKEKLREWEMRDSAGYSLPQQPGGPDLIYTLSSENQLSSHRLGAFLQDSYKFQSEAGLFTVTAGARFSYWNWNREFLFSPRASVSLIPAFNDRFTFRLATGVYYQAPFYKEFRDTTTVDGIAYVTLNQKIRSQRSIQVVAGGDYSFRAMGRPFRFTAEVYYKALSNLIPYNIDNVRISYYGANMATGYATGLDMKLFGEFVPGTDSWLTCSIMKTEEKINGQWLPRPTDQRYNLSLYFTDYFPRSKKWKMNLKGTLSGGLPFGPPHSGREAAVYRTPAYKRVDIGMSRILFDNSDRHRYGFGQNIKSIWIGLDVFNLLNINNVNSYYWVTDVYGNQFAVPNYLTGRQINVRLLIDF